MEGKGEGGCLILLWRCVRERGSERVWREARALVVSSSLSPSDIKHGFRGLALCLLLSHTHTLTHTHIPVSDADACAHAHVRAESAGSCIS